ncbi:MAG: hypothetical protein JOZ42_02830 [Acetobacteraceae bacterium]|nr:hypothetical protein [Acetobacteraceae bacterium]
MLTNWNHLSNALQLTVTRAALQHAAHCIASQAEALASEMEDGALTDRGGPDALRLLAAVVRLAGGEEMAAAGHA